MITEDVEETNLAECPDKMLPPDQLSNMGAVIQQKLSLAQRPETAVDVLLVNPPSLDSGLGRGSDSWVGWRSSKQITWPQISLAQMAAMLAPDYKVAVVDAEAQRLSWAEFEADLHQKQPRYYLTPVRTSTQHDDLFGALLAHGVGAKTIALGTHVTARIREIMDLCPYLDFVLRDEPELTLRELVDTLEAAANRWSESSAEPATWAQLKKMFQKTNPNWQPAWHTAGDLEDQLKQVQGLAWRSKEEILLNPERPLIPDLDDLPLPHYHLLPLNDRRLPFVNHAYACILTSRGHPSAVRDEVEQVGHQSPIRVRAPENIMADLWLLYDLGIHTVHMIAEVFTANREQVIGLCNMIIAEDLPLRWSCHTHVDYVDEEVLTLMARANCRLIAWSLEPVKEQAGHDTKEAYDLDQVQRALRWAKKAGIKNWGYFTIGLPDKTEECISEMPSGVQETISLAKALPLDLAFFQPAIYRAGMSGFSGPDDLNGIWSASYSPFSSLPVGGIEGGVAVKQATALTNGPLNSEELTYWQKRAFREWVLRPGAIWNIIKGLNSWAHFKNIADIGWQPLGQLNR